ncbi:hypothetical protein I4F81_005709 [Pyropia yezoensis]|uniref:Uncharacterized protein n=1 Tax=Pyropia yezoensis TaxID=2788 RepID=A0ACC3BZ03_PYRYE|nr:hypothetical protein I4F81_005709 [Neopyropia yezoensis]
MRGARATARGQLPVLTELVPGWRDADWVRGAAVPLLSQPATSFFPPSLGSPSGATPTLPSQVDPPACAPLTLAPSSDAVGVADRERPISPGLPPSASPSATNARPDLTMHPLTTVRRHPSAGGPDPLTGTLTASNNATPSPASSPGGRSPPGSTASPATPPALRTSPSPWRSAGSPPPSTTASQPASSAPPSSHRAPDVQQVVPVSLGPGGLGLMQAIATLARQLVDGHSGPVKLTGFYAVLQASTVGQSDRPQSIIIDCCGAKRTVEEKDLIMSAWKKQNAGDVGPQPQQGTPAALKKPPPLPKTVDVPNKAKDGDPSSGSEASDKQSIPDLTLNSAEMLLSLPKVDKGVKSLSLKERNAMLSSCGLRSYKQLTYNVAKAIFKRAHSVIVGRGVRKNEFSWTLVTPPELLLNRWSMAGASITVDGGCFFPPDTRNASQRGIGIERRRIALCVAAHVSPFWGAIVRDYFEGNPVNKVALPKRFKGGDDAFANANGRGSRRRKLRKLSEAAKAKSADVKDDGGKIPDESDDEYKEDEPASNGELPLAAVRISELARAVALPFEDLMLLELCPLLPSSAVLSAVSLSAAEFQIVRQEEDALRVVLPRELLKRAFQLLESVDKSAAGVEVDGRSPAGTLGAAMTSAAVPSSSPAVSIVVGSHTRMTCSSASLVHMSSVLSLNEQLQRCTAFRTWIDFLRTSTAPFPWELDFLVGSRLSVARAADQVLVACAKKRMGDPAWRYFLASAGAGGDMAGSNLFGGCTVAFSDIVLGGQREYMTNGVLDAALAEMRLHPSLRIMPACVLLTGQSAAFTTCHKRRVDEEEAVRKIKEVYDVMPPGRYEHILMMLNLVEQHWISAEVLPEEGKINIFDSSDGGFNGEKDFAVGRVKLFAQEVGRLRRLNNHLAPAVGQFEVKFVNTPLQADGYNCGPFALGHLWCAANGLQMSDLSYVVGDHLRLGILFTLLECGKRYDEARLSAIASSVVS